MEAFPSSVLSSNIAPPHTIPSPYSHTGIVLLQTLLNDKEQTIQKLRQEIESLKVMRTQESSLNPPYQRNGSPRGGTARPLSYHVQATRDNVDGVMVGGVASQEDTPT